jgi:regulator of sigma E protease
MAAILLFIAILAILILVHELGHFFVAKRAGARVEEFGIGFPPRIFGLKRGETVYSVNALPIGGFVKIYGEEDEKKDDPRSFASKNIHTRVFIVAAGVLMNVALAIILFSVGHSLGLPQVLDGEESSLASSLQGARVKNITVRIVDIAKDSPAEAAGAQIGDIIWALKSSDAAQERIQNIKDGQEFIGQFKGKEIRLSLKRGNDLIERNVVPRGNPPEGE